MKEGQGLYYPGGEFRSREEIMQQLNAGVEISVDKPTRGSPLPFEEQLKRVDSINKLRAENGFKYHNELTVNIDTGDFPFFLFRPLSDLHFPGSGVNTEKSREHLADIKKYPIYTAFLGDTANMYLPTVLPQAMMYDAITPDEQLQLVNAMMKEYQDKTLCSVPDPSHPGWLNKVAGIDPQRLFTEGTDIPTLINGGMLHLNINGIEYKGLLFHKISRYNSSLNITNAGKRMLDMMADVDFVISGHTHIGAMEKLVKRGKKPFIIQLGTFKTEDDYGMINGMAPNPQIFFPTIFFDSTRKNIECWEDNQTASKVIEALNKMYRRK